MKRKKANICWLWIKMNWEESKVSLILIILLFAAIFIATKYGHVKFFELYGKEFFGLCGSIIAIIIGLFVYKAQRRILSWDIRNRLICEYQEIYRHLGKNLEVLESINIDEGVPSILHIKKLKIDDHTTLTDGEIMKHISKEYTAIVYPMTICTRNYNITVECLEKAIDFKNKELFQQYLEEMKGATNRLQSLIAEDSLKFGCDLNHTDKKTRKIIYDKKNW